VVSHVDFLWYVLITKLELENSQPGIRLTPPPSEQSQNQQSHMFVLQK
jgi:hypothetical protein